MPRLVASVTALTLAISLPHAAHATVPPPPPITSGFAWNGAVVCGGNNFSTCASVSVVTVYDAVTRTAQVSMRVTNLSGTNSTFAGTIFTQMGLFNLPSGVGYQPGTTLTVVDQNGHAVAGWQLGTSGLSGAGITQVVRGVDPVNGINGGLAHGGTYTFTFSLSGWTSAPNMNTFGFAIHGQGGPNDCSTKLVIKGGTGNQLGSGAAACSMVTPEPVSMILTATGLAGMGGIGVSRRRRKNQTA